MHYVWILIMNVYHKIMFLESCWNLRFILLTKKNMKKIKFQINLDKFNNI
jgi:hypothetical protein